MTAATAADDLDRNELNLTPGSEEGHQRFGFNLEVFSFQRQGRPGF